MKHKWIQAAVGIVLLAIATWFVYVLLQAGAAIQSGILALVGVVSAGIITHSSAKRREIEARHFNEKREGYTAFIDMMIESLLAEKMGKKRPTERQLMQKIMQYKKMLLIWADTDVIRMWNKVELMGIGGANVDSNSNDILLLWDELLRMMRKDLGKDDSQLAKGELISLILLAGEKHKVK